MKHDLDGSWESCPLPGFDVNAGEATPRARNLHLRGGGVGGEGGGRRYRPH